MNPARHANLRRLLAPRHIAVIGGDEAAVVAGECARIGYAGALWPVNPKRARIGGHTCFARVEDLPQAPDAVFLAVPREVAIDTLARLRRLGAGGAVCYAAGFGETGAEGARLERELVAAAGDMALVGPNCYGFINYIERVALWPFAHGGGCRGQGAAVISQSGMLSSDLTMSQRSLPLSHMVSLGNQAMLSFEDFIDVLHVHPGVRAIGLHIEGLRDVGRFAAAARACVEAGVPIVALKSGRSKIGARLTVSHTGSLSGTDDLYQALFDRLGIIRVDTPAQLLETLKYLCVAGVPKGTRLAGLTCSGGGATLLADHAEPLGLSFPPPSPDSARSLATCLPYTATISNPLDYTTPIWGVPERVQAVFETLFRDPVDAAVLVQDYPLAGLDESRPYYLSDARCFIAATRAAGVPACVCSTLPENLDHDTREMLVENGVAPMQGIRETLVAIAGAAWHGQRRERLRQAAPAAPATARPAAPTRVLDEWQGKQRLLTAGLAVPAGIATGGAEVVAAAVELGFPVVLKMLGANLPHKTEAGAVALGITDSAELETALAGMRASVARRAPEALTDRFLVERMQPRPVAELLVDARIDPDFGPVMTLASGGVLAELLADAVTLLLPASREDLADALARLRIARLLDGYRGASGVERGVLIDTLQRLAEVVCVPNGDIVEVEINPLFVMPADVCAVDVLMRVTPPAVAPTGEAPADDGGSREKR